MNLQKTIFVLDDSTTYVNLKIEQSLKEHNANEKPQAMGEFLKLHQHMTKFYNFLGKIPVPTIVVSHEVPVGADVINKIKGVSYPLLGSSSKSKDVGANRFTSVIRTIKKSPSEYGGPKAIQTSRTATAFASVGIEPNKILNKTLVDILCMLIGDDIKPIENEESVE